jgi:DNA repair protein RadD
MKLRHYQEQAIEAIFQHIFDDNGNAPLVEMATGTGKNPTIGTLITRFLEPNPQLRILMLVHVKELVEQNYKTFCRINPMCDVGIYSAGMGRRDTRNRVIFASIQSIYNKADLIGAFDLVIVDEAHLISENENSMYGKLFAALQDLKAFTLIGFTATPYRMGQGSLEGAIFEKIVYRYGLGQGIKDGFLSPLRSKRGVSEIDVSGVKITAGEFNAGALEAAASNQEMISSAVQEIVHYFENRRLCLVFGSGVKHCHLIKAEFQAKGYIAKVVTGDTPAGERAATFQGCRDGSVKILIGMNTFTTGFDVPHVDLIALMRSTLSTSLFVQMLGRGTRKADGKDDCLILDYGGNVMRHGPVDLIEIKSNKKYENDNDGVVKPSDERAKVCAHCGEFNPIPAIACVACDAQFPIREVNHADRADGERSVTSLETFEPVIKEVIDWKFQRHLGKKNNATGEFKKDTLLISYKTSELKWVRQWLCPEHGGFTSELFARWWRERGGHTVPKTIDEALTIFASEGTLYNPVMPEFIKIVLDGKFETPEPLKPAAALKYRALKEAREKKAYEDPEIDLIAAFQ